MQRRAASCVEGRREAAVPDPGDAAQDVAVEDEDDPFDAAQLEPGVQPELKQQPDWMLLHACAQEAGGRG